MYTVDDKNNEFEEEYVNNSSWDNKKGLIVKIIIIILCVIVLIWLFKALKVKRNIVEDESVHIANVEKVRLAAEDYFFVKNNKNSTASETVNLNDLKNNGLSTIVDANNKVCNEKSSKVILTPEVNAYKMTVKLACSTNEKEEEFLYHNETLACLNCNGNTIMKGDIQDDVKKEEQKEVEKEGVNKNDDYVIPVDNQQYDEYSCIKWSDWSKKRNTEPYLEERSKTLVQGVKYENNIIYGDWSEYTTTPIDGNDGIEVETKTVNEDVWSEPKTSTSVQKNDPNIKILSVETVVSDTPSCNNGYVLNNVCYSNKTITGNLTFKEYNSGKYLIKNDKCEGVKTLKNSDGKYVLTYVNCKYNEVLNENVTTRASYNIYTYQELMATDVIYYRYRTITKINDGENKIYTNDKYEEEYLPDGFVKLPGSEETYYSYKIPTCEK